MFADLARRLVTYPLPHFRRHLAELTREGMLAVYLAKMLTIDAALLRNTKALLVVGHFEIMNAARVWR